MPRNYVRKSSRQSWDPASMLKAIEAVNNGEMGWLKASKTYHIPQATLRRHALQKNKTLKKGEKRLGRFKTTFPVEVERQLVEHLKLLESRFFGLTRQDVLELAYNLAVKNGFEHQFNIQKKAAGKDWLRGFRKRNRDITLRKPEATSAARAQAFNKPQVAQFFKVFDQIMQKENIDPMRIYNADESALSTVQRPQKIFATAGRKQVGAITSAERGSHVRVVCCMCTAGNFIPPALIFPRKNMKKELADHAPAGTLCIAQESGWMTGPVFLQWLQHFQKYVKASPTEKVLLIVDGHASHKYLDALV
ncbi:jerky protein homolog-like [Diorhabda carinulata]|uniref:jerky protein homolog-like n=1 Tax=Diorhabda carinulata TaxID=1163345 RepID=UPI0025A07ADE|nr:jerky protein homolog-like [Diorhabda carinulata]